MGGASRNDNRRKRQESADRLAAAGIQVPERAGPNRVVLIVAAVLAAVLVVGIGAWYLRGSSSTATPTYTASRSAAVVTAGSGPVVIDVYEDFLCPACERFEERYGADLTEALNANKITVRYHTIAILDRLTTPAGYSTRAGDAALCAADAGIYPGYHAKLFGSQPAEQSAGLTDDQLIAFGTDLGARGDFAGCVRANGHDQEIKAATQAAANNPALQTEGQFGTPTVAIGGQKIDLSDSNWLKSAIGG